MKNPINITFPVVNTIPLNLHHANIPDLSWTTTKSRLPGYTKQKHAQGKRRISISAPTNIPTVIISCK